MPAQPSTKLPMALRIRSAGMSATIAPTPNCHIRPKVTKYAGAGFVIVKTTQKTKDTAVTDSERGDDRAAPRAAEPLHRRSMPRAA